MLGPDYESILRDVLAALAMRELMQHDLDTEQLDTADLAALAYEQADEMLRARTAKAQGDGEEQPQ